MSYGQQTDTPIPIVKLNPVNLNTYVTQQLVTLGIKHRVVYLKALGESDALTVKDDLTRFMIPAEMDNMVLLGVAAAIYTTSSSGLPAIQVRNGASDMLTTPITIDVSGLESYNATTPAVINGAHQVVAQGDIISIDCDVAGTGTKGLDVVLTFGAG